ncbi:hypothetical protein [Erwinia sp. ErVv1]|uniref:hypothetical protein n=1 Tax=Erwinia sp. ErVv1 TaxID=1603299 RepID=UPI00082ECF74|nr:hypothetical protein [Erwinia sp. ErVv1]
MTKTEKMLALRKRFNPDSNDALLDLNVDELCQKFRYSQQIYLNFESTIEQHFATLNQNQEEQIFSGHPILTASLGENKPAIGEHNLESDYHIKHFQVSRLFHLRDIIQCSKIVPFTDRETPEPDYF